jgi:uncharacterized caspase-like protein
LVIGNAQYKISPLENPVNDATDVDRTLKQLGFQTTLLRNATLGQMREATRRFADQLQSADVALIYFAGHGVESNRKNYMIPVNADLKPRWPPKLPHLWPRQTPPPELIGDRG